MYTWGYIKENTLGKLNIGEEEANRLGFLSRFPYYANEAMTQICSAVKPDEKIFEFNVTADEKKVDAEKGIYLINAEIKMPEDFIAFSDDVPYIIHMVPGLNYAKEYIEAGDEDFTYRGYSKVICHKEGLYQIPYRARWFFFTKDLTNEITIPAPADICDALPSYIASQCFKIDDEVKSAVYRNEYEMFLSRMDDTSYRAQRTFHIGGGW